MKEVFAHYFDSLIVVLELVALGFSFFSLHKKNDKIQTLFIPILVCICIVEFLGSWIKVEGSKNNVFYYNVLDIFLTVSYSLIIGHFLRSKWTGLMVNWAIFLYFIFSIVNLGWLQGSDAWNTNSVVAGSTLIVLVVAAAFTEISSVKSQIHLRREPLFWICCSVLVYFFPGSVLTSAYSLFSGSDESAAAYGNAFHLGQNIINIFHYSLLSFSFICRLIFRA